MPDEDPTGFRIAGEQPPIPVGTAVNLSSERPRIAACSNPLQVRIARLNGKGGSVMPRAVYSFLRSSCLTSAARRGGWELRADD